MWDFVGFFLSNIYESLFTLLTPIISCITYLYTFGNYIQESLQVTKYLNLGPHSSIFLYSFFGYILIFLYLFSTHLWGSVGVTKNFNLKHISKYMLGDSILLVALGKKRWSILWYYYFIHYTL